MAENIKYRFIQNVGDYFSPGFFSEDFLDKVKSEKGVSNDEMVALCKPYVKLRQEYEEYKNYIVNANPRIQDAIKHTHEFNGRLMKILGYSKDTPYDFYEIDREANAYVPVRQVLYSGQRPSMLIMEMQHLIPIGDEQPSSLFEQSYNVEGEETVVRNQRYYAGQWKDVFDLPSDKRISPAVINKAIDAIFLLPMERRPQYILMLAGNVLFLLKEEEWHKGAYLQLSLDELFSLVNTKARDFRLYPALFHLLVCKESLVADSGLVLMDKLVEDSYKNAYGVTKELKDGVVFSIQTLADEALKWWKNKKNLTTDNYTDEKFAAEVKDDCLTIVYRLLFIFYAESRDELGILPMNDEVYKYGYSLEMLRDLETVPLISEDARNGFFIHESLQKLFHLLATGYNEEGANMKDKTLSVRHIDSPLFDDERLKKLKDVKFCNKAWQDIIKALSLSHRKKQVGRISYANLGINQLGSVYESLLAYRGFYAEQDYIEVHKANEPEEGTYLVPYSRMDDFKEKEILRDSDGQIVVHKQGKFLYRLNGRDRQKSASYYTPEVLTRSTVKYTLEAIINEVKENKREALELLDLKILEPAMGAAAFQNEVINQLAEAYLTYQQQQKKNAGCKNWRISPDHYRNELQKVKAYIATHNVYGVDLNPTAIELGKLSLWLNVIHKDMETPFFSNRLVVGNAVIGAWLKVYSKDEVLGINNGRSKNDGLLPNPWWERAPHKVEFYKTKVKRKVDEIYHFLLPDKNMLAVRNIREQRLAHPTEYTTMNGKINEWTEAICEEEFKILQRLSAKIDTLLKEYFEFQQSVEDITQNKMALWGTKGEMQGEIFTTENYKTKEELNNTRYRHDNAYFRLKMVMDYWCSLWFWDYDRAKDLPTRREYWSDIDAMLNVSNETLYTKTKQALNVTIDSNGQVGMFAEGKTNDLFNQPIFASQKTQNETIYTQKEEDSEIKRLTKEEILSEVKGDERGLFDDSKRFAIVSEYADRYHFFHPMLEFLEVFWLRGGFDIICGNPPWIKLEFKESSIISEKFPEVVIRRMGAHKVRELKTKLFIESPALKHIYQEEEKETICSSIFLNAKCNYPLLEGQQTDLYKCVVENSFSMLSDSGYVGLLHPESTYEDTEGQVLRREAYMRLRYHFQFINELKLFDGVHHETSFGEHIYASKRDDVDFISIHNLYHPNTIDACLVHDGHGECGGIKTEDNKWNTKAHKDRIVNFTECEFRKLSSAFENGADWKTVKLVRLHTKNLVSVVEKLGKFHSHVRDYNDKIISRSIEESKGISLGIISKNIGTPTGEYDVIMSGPHIYVSNPFNKLPYENYHANNDYDSISLLEIDESFVPRTIFFVTNPKDNAYLDYVKGFLIGQDSEGNDIYDKWIDYSKFAYRLMIGPNSERTLVGCMLPSKWNHISGLNSIIFKDTNLSIEFAALASSLSLDFFLKVIGAPNLMPERLKSFPLGVEHKYKSALFIRTLMLNCLSTAYSDLWSEMWNDGYKDDSWSKEDTRLKSFSSLTHQWEWATPLRNAFERRQALVEIDVISAMALGLSLQDLEMIYNIQFPVLYQNEKVTWYDAEGKIVYTCSVGLNGVGLSRPQWEAMRGEQSEDGMTYKGTSPTYTHTIDPARSRLYGGQEQKFIAPYTRCDRIEDYRRAWEHFEKRFKQ